MAVDTGRSVFPPVLPSLMPAAVSAWSLERATAAPRSAVGGPILAQSPNIAAGNQGRVDCDPALASPVRVGVSPTDIA